MGFIPLIMKEHTYHTYLEDADWFAIGNSTATDFFLFWKQWAFIILALICLLILLIRAKYYYEELPWDKRAFIPLLVYGAFVVLSACFARMPVFAWAGGYDMFQSAPAILSYGLIFYYTYSCIKSTDHLLYLLRGSEIGIGIELVLCFFQAIGHDLLATVPGKILVTSPSRWNKLDSLTLSSDMYGTVYNTDYLSLYLPMVIPVILGLFIVETKLWKRIVHAALLLLSLFVLVKAPSSAILAVGIETVIAFVILCSRQRKLLISGTVMLACLAFAGASVILCSSDYYRTKADLLWNGSLTEDSDVPIKSIRTGSLSSGVTVELRDGKIYRFTFSMDQRQIKDLKVYDGSGNQLALTETNTDNQTYVFSDAAEQAEGVYFYRDDSGFVSRLMFVKDGVIYPFIDTDVTGPSQKKGYYLVSTAGRCVKLPQKNKGEVYEVFKNGFWSGRGPIYNRSLPLLKHHMLIGTGADNYIMAYPQRDYINDYYFNGQSNGLNVKPHSLYLQIWIQEGFIAFVAIMVFFFIYLKRSAVLYHSVTLKDHSRLMGFLLMTGIIGYLIAAIANDSMICTAPVFWTALGAGWGMNTLQKEENDHERHFRH